MSIIAFYESILQYEFLQRALLTSVLVGIVCGVIGCFIILRGMSLMGDAISHAVLPGVAISYMLGINIFYGAVVTGLLTAIAIGYISQNSRIKDDTSIGIMFTAAFAVGIIVITFLQSSTDLYHILFGNVLAVPTSEMWMTLIVTVIVLLSVYLFFNTLSVNGPFNNGYSCFIANSRDCISCSDVNNTCSNCLPLDESLGDYGFSSSWFWRCCFNNWSLF